jgi:hypothetical protein
MHRTGSSPASHTTTRQTESFFSFLPGERATTWRDLQEEGAGRNVWAFRGMGVSGYGRFGVWAFRGVSVRWTLGSNETYGTYRTYVITPDEPTGFLLAPGF